MTNRVANSLRFLLRGFLQHDHPVPYDSIGSIDSRMWDPEWREKYGDDYYSLWRILTWGLNDPGKAQTIASGDSYYWGPRGGWPMMGLPHLGTLSVEDLAARLRRWLVNVRRGFSVEATIWGYLNPFVYPLTEEDSD